MRGRKEVKRLSNRVVKCYGKAFSHSQARKELIPSNMHILDFLIVTWQGEPLLILSYVEIKDGVNKELRKKKKKKLCLRTIKDGLERLSQIGLIDIFSHYNKISRRHDRNSYGQSDRWFNFGADCYVPPEDRKKICLRGAASYHHTDKIIRRMQHV